MKLPIDRLSQGLGLSSKKVERWISQGKIPVRQDGTSCSFNQAALERWARNNYLSFSLPDADKKNEPVLQLENLLPAMKRGGVYYNIEGQSIEEVLQNAVEELLGLSDDSKQILTQRLIEREELTSTGIGKGVAIPHPRGPISGMEEKPLLCTCFLKTAIDYKSVDDRPVSVLFILLSPSTKGHLHLLSRLAFCVRDDAFVSFLETMPEADLLFKEISKFETQLDRSDG
jgi:nitrogen PTS system EIIA component